MNLETSDYPALYQAGDRASVNAQWWYMTLMGVDLGMMTLSALLTVYNFTDEEPKVAIYVASALMLLLSFFITFILKTQKFEEAWYQGRALAESVKTLTWRYATCAENFEESIPDDKVQDIFIGRLEALLINFDALKKELNAKVVALPQVTKKLNQIRKLSFQDKKSFYITNRIKDQKEWYSNKAGYNDKMQGIWFATILVAQFLSICGAAALVFLPNSNWNLVGLFTTIAASSIAWLQLKQHRELKQAYTTAVIELNFIEEKSFTITNQDQFSRYVLDSENAISREHTLWLAQKRK